MQRNLLIVVLCFFAIAITSCTNTEPEIQLPKEEISSNDSSENQDYYGIFPNSPDYQEKLLSRAGNNQTSFDTDWEFYQSIRLNSGTLVNTPWALSTAQNTIKQYRFDVKKEDGWRLVYKTIGANMPDPYENYIVFYNLITGNVKVFYYLEGALSSESIRGVWKIMFPSISLNKWLNAVDPIATPSNYSANNIWNASTVKTEGGFQYFNIGWNSFMFTATYWPNQNETLDFQIDPYNINELNATFYPNFQATTSGILTSYTPNSGNNIIGKVLGEGAGQLAKTIINNIPYVNTVSGLLSNGISKLVSSFVGKRNATFDEQTSNLELVSSFNGTVDGVIYANTNAPIPPVAFPVNTDLWGTAMGAWNLSESPTVYIHPVGVLNQEMGYDFATYTFERSGRYNCPVIMNPTMASHVVKYWTEVEPIRYYSEAQNPAYVKTYNYNLGALGSLTSENNEVGKLSRVFPSDLIYGNYGNNYSLYDDYLRSNVSFSGVKNRYNVTRMPKYVLLPSVSNLSVQPIKYLNKEHLVRVVLHVVTDFKTPHDTIVMSRTYIPKFEWDPQLINKYTFNDINMLESYIEATNDPIIRQQVIRNNRVNYSPRRRMIPSEIDSNIVLEDDELKEPIGDIDL